MSAPITHRWLSAFLLATFVVGGLGAPLVHQIEHAARPALPLAHAHDEAVPISLHADCPRAAELSPDCFLCHRNLMSTLVLHAAAVADAQHERYAVAFGEAPSLPAPRYAATRAPPFLV